MKATSRARTEEAPVCAWSSARTAANCWPACTRSWGKHLELETNLIIDHFLQDGEWKEDVLEIFRDSGAHVFSVGVFCSVAELERRESSRGDGGFEGRPLGLARRSDELCHAHDLEYDVTVRTDEQSTTESVEAIIAAMRDAGLLM